MSETSLPPCGPERDRLVAQAVGWEWPATVAIGLEATRLRYPSTIDADALAALEAWKAEDIGRHVTVDLGYNVTVRLIESDRRAAFGQGPALRHAATAALVRWYLDTQEGK